MYIELLLPNHLLRLIDTGRSRPPPLQPHHDEDRPPEPLPRGRRRRLPPRLDGVQRPLARHHAVSGEGAGAGIEGDGGGGGGLARQRTGWGEWRWIGGGGRDLYRGGLCCGASSAAAASM